ncbi:LADA_0A06348g1_1 [Lachancea dasiensis]|uniref:LADA_0A06348g1_1 n=1 Tax=Lachancea dasiensis TaxID=1072105 RepID=A0A1G4IPH0_9SACH|nr:LADA_0A06348g1_1 [Lachancea dasiensis]
MEEHRDGVWGRQEAKQKLMQAVEDSSTEALWQMYSSAKASLPFQDRMSNLTWRMLGLRVKRARVAKREQIGLGSPAMPTVYSEILHHDQPGAPDRDAVPGDLDYIAELRDNKDAERPSSTHSASAVPMELHTFRDANHPPHANANGHSELHRDHPAHEPPYHQLKTTASPASRFNDSNNSNAMAGSFAAGSSIMKPFSQQQGDIHSHSLGFHDHAHYGSFSNVDQHVGFMADVDVESFDVLGGHDTVSQQGQSQDDEDDDAALRETAAYSSPALISDSGVSSTGGNGTFIPNSANTTGLNKTHPSGQQFSSSVTIGGLNSSVLNGQTFFDEHDFLHSVDEGHEEAELPPLHATNSQVSLPDLYDRNSNVTPISITRPSTAWQGLSGGLGSASPTSASAVASSLPTSQGIRRSTNSNSVRKKQIKSSSSRKGSSSFANINSGTGIIASSLPQDNGSMDGLNRRPASTGPNSSAGTPNAANKVETKCTNCHTKTTPLWRRDPEGNPLCNACGLFLKLHGVVRPLSLKTDVIKKRQRASNKISGSNAGSAVKEDSSSRDVIPKVRRPGSKKKMSSSNVSNELQAQTSKPSSTRRKMRPNALVQDIDSNVTSESGSDTATPAPTFAAEAQSSSGISRKGNSSEMEVDHPSGVESGIAEFANPSRNNNGLDAFLDQWSHPQSGDHQMSPGHTFGADHTFVHPNPQSAMNDDSEALGAMDEAATATGRNNAGENANWEWLTLSL